nr:hypothetical protein [Candidatus Sigynarchaeota archaeon]
MKKRPLPAEQAEKPASKFPTPNKQTRTAGFLHAEPTTGKKSATSGSKAKAVPPFTVPH